ncbi:MAG: tRNA uridine-5-carboxymethylaminomethyl(34) synthesis enzyme MnmG [Elusimicrobia bacterium]|nr:tRNA uridine-5-carboxymethylaminomethyl(34) synthesis enzyme MnmG [Elusimicrobiota bacterium]
MADAAFSLYPRRYDVIVVGAGHAGVEAALASSRMGRKTLLLTQSLDTIATMSCNPSIGGVGKGQMVRELDALGGEMAKAADRSSYFSQTLNLSKGQAVRSPRAQCDKAAYRAGQKKVVEAAPGLDPVQDEAWDIWTDGSAVRGVISKRGTRYEGKTVVLTTGTFLNGLAHVGLSSHAAGRSGEPPALGVSASLKALGLAVGRLKTGTPPRLHAATVDFSKFERQDGDPVPKPFSHFTERIATPQLPSWVAYTNARTHQTIRDNLANSPLYSGKIEGVGPRYCPSIEDKVVKFPHKERHQLFLEPEGWNTSEMYLNGMSTSLPEAAQRELVSTIPGLENALLTRYGYAIEYDFCQPTQLTDSLECRAVPGLFLAGQINGTTGYEEAASQGLLAGINAALRAASQAPFTLRRDEAYIGVMVDDLVLRGVDEPYRMFTARAENRLSLRADDADMRLMEKGFALGLIAPEARERFLRYKELVVAGTGDKPDEELAPWSMDKVRDQRAVRESYGPYIARERAGAERLKAAELTELPAALDYTTLGALTNEARQKLARLKPRTLGQAGRVPGVTPADVQILWVHSRRQVIPNASNVGNAGDNSELSVREQ